MGISWIEGQIEIEKEMKKKGEELLLEKLQAEAELTMKSRERMEEIAKRYGVILAFSPEARKYLDELKKKYGIRENMIITENITENDVVEKGFLGRQRIIHEKLAMLLFQRALLLAQENGGILSFAEAYSIVATGILKNVLKLEDVEKAVEILQRKNMIPGVTKIEESRLIRFLPVELSKDHEKILALAMSKEYLTDEMIITLLGWNPHRTRAVMDYLVRQNVAVVVDSYKEGRRYYFPGIASYSK